MNIKVVIPARYGSSRLPGKPLLKINGVEVVNHVVQRCIEAGVAHSDIFVASDDGRILEVIDNTKSMAIMTDSKHQSG
ncbi:cytidylyltransferase domain-containing protein, partial [Vibrio parahaemolyticus]